MDERKILARFEKRNILDSNDPVFDIIIQQNEIVTTNVWWGRSRSDQREWASPLIPSGLLLKVVCGS